MSFLGGKSNIYRNGKHVRVAGHKGALDRGRQGSYDCPYNPTNLSYDPNIHHEGSGYNP